MILFYIEDYKLHAANNANIVGKFFGTTYASYKDAVDELNIMINEAIEEDERHIAKLSECMIEPDEDKYYVVKDINDGIMEIKGYISIIYIAEDHILYEYEDDNGVSQNISISTNDFITNEKEAAIRYIVDKLGEYSV